MPWRTCEEMWKGWGQKWEQIIVFCESDGNYYKVTFDAKLEIEEKERYLLSFLLEEKIPGAVRALAIGIIAFASKITNVFAGITGWKVEDVVLVDKELQIYFIKYGSPVFLAFIVPYIPRIISLLKAVGIFVIGWKVINLATEVVEHKETVVEKEFVQKLIDAGWTREEIEAFRRAKEEE